MKNYILSMNTKKEILYISSSTNTRVDKSKRFLLKLGIERDLLIGFYLTTTDIQFFYNNRYEPKRFRIRRKRDSKGRFASGK